MSTTFPCCKKGFASVDEEIFWKWREASEVVSARFKGLILDNGAERGKKIRGQELVSWKLIKLQRQEMTMLWMACWNMRRCSICLLLARRESWRLDSRNIPVIIPQATKLTLDIVTLWIAKSRTRFSLLTWHVEIWGKKPWTNVQTRERRQKMGEKICKSADTVQMQT